MASNIHDVVRAAVVSQKFFLTYRATGEPNGWAGVLFTSPCGQFVVHQYCNDCQLPYYVWNHLLPGQHCDHSAYWKGDARGLGAPKDDSYVMRWRNYLLSLPMDSAGIQHRDHLSIGLLASIDFQHARLALLERQNYRRYPLAPRVARSRAYANFRREQEQLNNLLRAYRDSKLD